MRHALLVTISYAALFVGIGTLIHLVSLDKLESTLESKTAEALTDTLHARTEGVSLDLQDVSVTFGGMGLHGKVRGSVPDEETLTFVERAVASIDQDEVASVTQVASLTSDLRLSARCQLFLKDNQPFIRGLMSPAMAHEVETAVKSALQRSPQDASLAGDAQEDLIPEFRREPNVDEPSWSLPLCEFLKDYLPRTRDADVSINNQHIFIGGLVDHQDDKDRIIAQARQLFANLPEDRMDVSSLEVDAPAIPSRITVRTDTDGSVTIAGQVQSQGLADTISDSIERSLQSYQALTNVSLQISDRAEPISWIQDFESYTRQMFATVAYPRLDVQGSQVIIAGQVPDQGTRDALGGKTEAHFKDLTVVNQLKVASQENDLAKLADLASSTDIHFDVNQSTIKGSEVSKLRVLASALQENPGTKVVIFGFADPTGDVDANLRLSRLRCQAAQEQLIKWGVDASTLEIVQRGADTSVNTEDPNSLQHGRRVEFELEASTE